MLEEQSKENIATIEEEQKNIFKRFSDICRKEKIKNKSSNSIIFGMVLYNIDLYIKDDK